MKKLWQTYWLRAALVSAAPLLMHLLVVCLLWSGIYGESGTGFLILSFRPSLVFAVVLPFVFLPELKAPLRYRIIRGICSCLAVLGWNFVSMLFFLFSVSVYLTTQKYLLLGLGVVGSVFSAGVLMFIANIFLCAGLGRRSFLRLLAFVLTLELVFLALASTSLYVEGGAAALSSGIWYFAFTLALSYESSCCRGEQPAAKKEREQCETRPAAAVPPAPRSNGERGLRSIKIMFLVLLVLPVLAVAAYILLAVASYDGYCYGFTDGKWQCSFAESLSQGVFFLLIVVWPLVFLWIASLVVTVVSYFVFRKERKSKAA